jgi:hypothetical protein
LHGRYLVQVDENGRMDEVDELYEVISDLSNFYNEFASFLCFLRDVDGNWVKA